MDDNISNKGENNNGNFDMRFRMGSNDSSIYDYFRRKSEVGLDKLPILCIIEAYNTQHFKD